MSKLSWNPELKKDKLEKVFTVKLVGELVSQMIECSMNEAIWRRLTLVDTFVGMPYASHCVNGIAS